MTMNIEDLSTAQLVGLKQMCETLLNKRHTAEIEKALDKLFSALDELNHLDPDGYDWYGLKNEIQNTYDY